MSTRPRIRIDDRNRAQEEQEDHLPSVQERCGQAVDETLQSVVHQALVLANLRSEAARGWKLRDSLGA